MRPLPLELVSRVVEAAMDEDDVGIGPTAQLWRCALVDSTWREATYGCIWRSIALGMEYKLPQKKAVHDMLREAPHLRHYVRTVAFYFVEQAPMDEVHAARDVLMGLDRVETLMVILTTAEQASVFEFSPTFHLRELLIMAPYGGLLTAPESSFRRFLIHQSPWLQAASLYMGFGETSAEARLAARYNLAELSVMPHLRSLKVTCMLSPTIPGPFAALRTIYFGLNSPAQFGFFPMLPHLQNVQWLGIELGALRVLDIPELPVPAFTPLPRLRCIAFTTQRDPTDSKLQGLLRTHLSFLSICKTVDELELTREMMLPDLRAYFPKLRRITLRGRGDEVPRDDEPSAGLEGILVRPRAALSTF